MRAIWWKGMRAAGAVQHHEGRNGTEKSRHIVFIHPLWRRKAASCLLTSPSAGRRSLLWNWEAEAARLCSALMLIRISLGEWGAALKMCSPLLDCCLSLSLYGPVKWVFSVLILNLSTCDPSQPY